MLLHPEPAIRGKVLLTRQTELVTRERWIEENAARRQRNNATKRHAQYGLTRVDQAAQRAKQDAFARPTLTLKDHIQSTRSILGRSIFETILKESPIVQQYNALTSVYSRTTDLSDFRHGSYLNSRFFIIVNPGNERPPTKRFATFKDAEAIAMKLARANPGQEFIVFESKTGSYVAPPAPTPPMQTILH